MIAPMPHGIYENQSKQNYFAGGTQQSGTLVKHLSVMYIYCTFSGTVQSCNNIRCKELQIVERFMKKRVIFYHSQRRHLHYLWNTNMTAWLHHWNESLQELNCLASLDRSNLSHLEWKRISSLSIDRQLKFYITAWPQLGSDSAKNGNKSIKYTGGYFTAVKASSLNLSHISDSAGNISNTIQNYVIRPRKRTSGEKLYIGL